MYCKFCKLVVHDEKVCRALQLLQENTVDTCLMKNDEKMQAKRAQIEYHPTQYPPPKYKQPKYPQL